VYSDNGCGLEDHQKGKIFEPFYTTKFGSGGSGLGLHLLYNIISTALQGQIDIIEVEDQSLSFKLHLPNLIYTNDSLK
jgi:signal transduction histidine kinase